MYHNVLPRSPARTIGFSLWFALVQILEWWPLAIVYVWRYVVHFWASIVGTSYYRDAAVRLRVVPAFMPPNMDVVHQRPTNAYA